MAKLPAIQNSRKEFEDALSEFTRPAGITYPDASHIHLVTDAELKDLVGFAKPIQAGFSLTAIGVFFPSIPGALPAVQAIFYGSSVDYTAATWLIVASMSFVVSVICGINGIKGILSANSMAARIRNRPRTDLPVTAIDGFASDPLADDIRESGGFRSSE